MKIAIITAGGAGMFCGSCMQDNTLARALRHAGHEVTLIPTYTPIRVDEEDASGDRVFLGGVNVYLDSAVPGWWKLPRWLTGWLDRPGVLKRLTRRSGATDASKLGWLTVDILKGDAGPQRHEIQRLVDWLTDDFKPDLVLFSNALLSGIVPSLRKQFAGTIVCLLQGDDIFLDGLPDKWKQPALELIRNNSRHFDALLTHSAWYAEFLVEWIGLPPESFRQIPLTIDTNLPADSGQEAGESVPPTVGYFARICPEKGIGNFLDMARRIAPSNPSVRFRIAGYLPDLHAKWFHRRLREAQEQIGTDRIEWLGSPDGRDEKFRILRSFHLLCVPADYREPKGIFVLEAGLLGVRSLVPQHGAYPELIEGLGHGTTYEPASPAALDQAVLENLNAERHNDETAALQRRVEERHGMAATGPAVSRILSEICEANRSVRSPEPATS